MEMALEIEKPQIQSLTHWTFWLKLIPNILGKERWIDKENRGEELVPVFQSGDVIRVMPPPYFSRLRSAVQRSIVGDDGALQDSVTITIKVLSDLEALLRPGNVVAASAASQLVNQRKNLSVVGAISRTFSIPSVSGPSLQCNIQQQNRTFDSFQKATMSLKNHGQPNNSAIYGYFLEEVVGSYPVIDSGSKEFHSSSSSCFSAGPAHDVSFDNSSREEQPSSSADSSYQDSKPGKALKLVSASCYYPTQIRKKLVVRMLTLSALMNKQ
ncbi:hypothetical protein F8388_002813 [Cannabis sativa]|uniref:Uncharacterized protein n=1 Tax=Cannabis sativa TaxID=3483 RepID=A0A7J6EFR8_CANSA|nr:hypothetical protein F8388_002813 [Cannabis sativa]